MAFSLNRKARLANHASCTSRGQNANPLLVQTFSQVQQSGLVVDGDDGNFLITRHDEDFSHFLQIDKYEKSR